MVDKAPGDRKLSVPNKTLTLKPRVETGTVKQSFSHGRTKQVVVEKRGKRRIGGDAPATETHAPEPVVAKAVPAAPAKAPLARPAAPASVRKQCERPTYFLGKSASANTWSACIPPSVISAVPIRQRSEFSTEYTCVSAPRGLNPIPSRIDRSRTMSI